MQILVYIQHQQKRKHFHKKGHLKFHHPLIKSFFIKVSQQIELLLVFHERWQGLKTRLTFCLD